MSEYSIEIPPPAPTVPVPPTTVSDKVIAQGDSHFICQDYAITGTTVENGEGWAIVTDGCSGADDTDWGARLLALAASDCIGILGPTRDDSGDWTKIQESAELFFDQAIQLAAANARVLGLSPFVLTATLLVARTWQDKVVLLMYGDGIIGARQRGTKRWDLRTVSYAEGKASYPSYRLNPDTLALFRSFTTNIKHIQPGMIPDGTTESPTGLPKGTGDDFTLWVLPRDQFDVVALVSDGGTTFSEVNPAGYGPRRIIVEEEALAELLDYPLTTPAFVRRSYQAAKKRWKKLGWSHYDDLSIAALYMPPQGTQEG